MFIADLHIHSRYSRATSPQCAPGPLDLWARKKGLQLVGTGDFTHAAWREELKEKLTPAQEGLYTLKKEYRLPGAPEGIDPRFIVTGEISSIYKKNGKVRKVHNLILLPGLEAAEALSKKLEERGCNLHSDGRPILGLSSHNLLEITLETCPEAVFIPAHIWTPHFSLFGAYSGFDTIEECFDDLTTHIHALETGLSSDPPMNWRLSALDKYALVSNSDAHSPANLAREANLFDTDLSYPSLSRALSTPGSSEFYGTIEFFPEEGKYHFDGHRNCGVCQKPSVTLETGGICPVCGRKITVGVLHRVEALADRAEGFTPPSARAFESLVPLREVVASSLGFTPASKKAMARYEELIASLGPELTILRETPISDIQRCGGSAIAEAVRRLRRREVSPVPGYDGAYGKVEILSKKDLDDFSGQRCFPGFEEIAPPPKNTFISVQPSAGLPGTKVSAKKGMRTNSAPSLPYGLNEEQWQAASAREAAVAVLAGPGTGKTKTLVSRIACLVEQMNVPPEKITAVTFTNKAAGEMRSRLQDHFGGKKAVRKMTIGTFHSICLKMLRSLGRIDGIVDEFGAQSLLADILSDLGIKQSPREVLRKISKVKNGAPCSLPPDVISAYNNQLAANGLMDFDDILLRVLEYFETPGHKELPCPDHLLVDEFQDVSDLQYRLIHAWNKGGKGLFLIGDPDQSIYGFRGSSARCFERLLADLPSIRTISLNKNYRSTPQIIGCALASLAPDGKGRVLSPFRPDGRLVRVLEAPDHFSEALFITKEIGRMIGGIDLIAAHAQPGSDAAKPRGFSDIAVLYRTHRQAEVIGECLGIEGIPYTVAGRDEFLADPSVRSAQAFFKFLTDPADLYSLKIWLQSAGISAEDRKVILKSGAAPGENLLFSLLEKSAPASLSGHPHTLLKRFSSLIKKETPGRLMEIWIEENALSGHPNMERLLRTALMYPDMYSFLSNLSLGQEGDVMRSGSNKKPPDAVLLTTLHGAKGLEFPVVFLAGASDGIIPLKTGAGATDEQEERRLFYVGLTRAQEELSVLYTPAPSPFLSSFPKDCFELEKLHKKQYAKQISLFGV